jgi:hypothetical protein
MKNWYVLGINGNYKKVITSLIKKKIEIYHPKEDETPIFEHIIFVKTTLDIAKSLKSDEFKLLYWLSNPATITQNEINSIESFPKINVSVEKVPVNTNTIEDSYDKILILPSIGIKLVSRSGFKKLVEPKQKFKFIKSLFT